MQKTLPMFSFAEIGLYGDSAPKILLPKNLENIEESSFQHLQSRYYIYLTIPSSVKKIGQSAFMDSGLVLSFEDNSELKEIDDMAFLDVDFYDDVITLPDGLEKLGERSFYGKLSTLVIPSSVVDIGDSVCDRSQTTIKADPGTYAALYASENGFAISSSGNEDTSWLND